VVSAPDLAGFDTESPGREGSGRQQKDGEESEWASHNRHPYSVGERTALNVAARIAAVCLTRAANVESGSYACRVIPSTA